MKRAYGVWPIACPQNEYRIACVRAIRHWLLGLPSQRDTIHGWRGGGLAWRKDCRALNLFKRGDRLE